MLTALILVCSLKSFSDPGACTQQNAVHMLRVPSTFASPITCMLHGQAYLADTSIARDLAADEVVRVICAPTRSLQFGALREERQPGR